MMKKQRLTAPGILSRIIRDAARSWEHQDYSRYFGLMERARRMDPANHGLLLDLGSAHGKRYNYAGAQECFEKAVRLAPLKSEALAMAGVQCRGFGQYRLAREYFERAIAEKGASADTLVKLAELYERFRLLPEANELVLRALQMDPQCALAALVRARLDRLGSRLVEAEQNIRVLLLRNDPSTWSTRIRGWYELGAILDTQGRYDEAMAAFCQAKALIRPNAASRLDAQRAVHLRLKQAEEEITAAMLQRWAQQAGSLGESQRLSVLCGHPRSGTTLLEQVLDSHPEILSAEETTIFFCDVYLPLGRGLADESSIATGLESASPELLKTLRASYFNAIESFLEKPTAGRLVIDKNPSLTPLVPAIARVFPEANFLVALRDPRDVCLSCFMQPLPLNQVSAMFLDLGTTVEEYCSTMSLWRALAPRLPQRHLAVRYEDMVQDLESVARGVLEFLKIGWDSQVLLFHERASQKLVRSPTYAEVTRPVFKGAVGRWRNYQKHLERWLPSLEPFAKAFGYD